ncbi:carbohydrate ABC transporter permease [Breznakiella homolactica]|uniref:Sugar ABC transporter permease n=1 Tax=Breznakiella homolactica TaxID=2798577 RepID=A0A7T7XLI4_9SPIR|nr:sugar ABC transporter permease [Breznakiella homolactica]QQO08487.1 sugar ABC transporter permease [Breznakiella homolactica]
MSKFRLSENARNTRNGLLFALPWIIGFLAFSVYPLAASLYYSFTEFNPVRPPVWVGLDNFKDIFSDPLVFKSLGNTLFMAFVSTPINLFVAVLLASIVSKKFKGRGLVRTFFFLPSIIPMVAATMVWIWMFDPTYGFINNFLAIFGINGPSWLMDPRYTKWALLLMGTWCTGTSMLVCMAALQEVPNSYYESAEIDGANAVRKFFSITLPSVAHVLVYQAILNFINAFQYFQQVYVIVNASHGGGGRGVASGGPANSILMYPLYIFHNAFTYMKMGKASAMAWLLFIVVALLTVVMTRVTKKATENAGGE